MIRVTCPQGHRLVVRDEHADRKVRCPKCQVVMQPSAIREATAAPDAQQSHSPTRIFACPEGHRFRAREESLGRKVRCPRCRIAVRLPAAEPNPYSPPPEPVRPAAAELPPVPARVERQERVWPLFLIVGGAAATLLGIALWLRFTGAQ